MFRSSSITFFFFFNDTATTEIYTLSLHDALPISPDRKVLLLYGLRRSSACGPPGSGGNRPDQHARSEEHTSELQSQSNLVCRLLLEKKKSNRAASKPGSVLPWSSSSTRFATVYSP